MDTKARADLVRSIRIELKQSRERQARGFAVLDAAGRAQGRVQRWSAGNRERMDANNRRQREVYGRVGERIDRGIARAADAYDRTEWAPGSDASARRTAQAAARRQREHGYDISPDFRRRSAAMARTQSDISAERGAQGHGISTRWRGATRQVGLDRNTRLTEERRTAAILATRRQDPLAMDPTTYNPAPRPRRNPPGELRTGRPQRRRN